MLKKIWNDPVWSAVLAAGFVAIIGTIATVALGLWPYVQYFYLTVISAFIAVWLWLTSVTGVSNWILVLLSIVAFLTVARFLTSTAANFKKPQPTETNWTKYVEDTFFNIVWRWSYSNGKIQNLHSFCSHCDFRIYHKVLDLYDQRARYVCDNCGARLQEFDDRYAFVENLIMRKIDHNIRNGAWKNTVSDNKTRP